MQLIVTQINYARNSVHSLRSGKKNEQADKAILQCGKIPVHFIEHIITQYCVHNNQEEKKSQHV